MAHRTVFTCDHCEETAVDDNNFLTEVRVQIASPYSSNGFRDSTVGSSAWCEKCLVKFGLLHFGKTNLPASSAPAAPPTLEEVVRAIAREEAEAAVGNS